MKKIVPSWQSPLSEKNKKGKWTSDPPGPLSDIPSIANYPIANYLIANYLIMEFPIELVYYFIDNSISIFEGPRGILKLSFMLLSLNVVLVGD